MGMYASFLGKRKFVSCMFGFIDIIFTLQEAIESIVACSAMAVQKQEEQKNEEASSSENKWAKWKRGGIIGAAALTGGTLMAITGGMS